MNVAGQFAPYTPVVDNDAKAAGMPLLQVRDFLGRQGYFVIEAANGMEALKAAENFGAPIDALLTDVVMPQLNGPDLASNLKKRFPKMKIIFMSGYTEPKLGEPDAFKDCVLLQKPFPLRSLKMKLQELLTTPA